MYLVGSWGKQKKCLAYRLQDEDWLTCEQTRYSDKAIGTVRDMSYYQND